MPVSMTPMMMPSPLVAVPPVAEPSQTPGAPIQAGPTSVSG